MKRILIRLSMLTVLIFAGWFVFFDAPVSAARDCGMAVYNKWMSCDNAYANTVQTYAIRTPHCEQTAPGVCPYASVAICEQNPATYDQCCLAASRAACEATVSTNYDNRGSSYFSCMGIEGNFGNCVEQVADFCLTAQGRVSDCISTYDGLENSDARSTCIANSGIDRCQ